jgi:spermidine synthase
VDRYSSAVRGEQVVFSVFSVLVDLSTLNMSLVAKPSIKFKSLSQLKSDRCDKIYLYSSVEDKHWRYELTVVDRVTSSSSPNGESGTVVVLKPCVVFLIPTGRETEYIYASRRGLLSIAESANCARLIAVAFPRADCLLCDNNVADSYPSPQQVQEISTTVQLIALHNATYNGIEDKTIPFMVVDGIGQRNIIARGETSTTGPYLVEEVMVSQDQHFARRLYFMSNPHVIQSEVYMKKEDSRSINRLKLAFEYHMDIIAGFLLLGKMPSFPAKANSLIIGLGGGGLPNFIDAFFQSQLYMTAIELDPGVVDIAKEHFGLWESEKSLKIIIGDGLNVCPPVSSETERSSTLVDIDPISTSSSDIILPHSTMHLIVIDVDSKDTSIGMSCPPTAFIHVPYLQNLKELLIPEGGMLVINVSARDPDMLQLVKSNVCQVFSSHSVFISSIHDNEESERTSYDSLNVVIFAVRNENNTCICLPKGMDAVDKIFEAFDVYQVRDYELRGTMELCACKIKRIHYSNSTTLLPNDSTNSKVKSTLKKKSKGKKGKKR